jgi:hypothetical protein
MFVNGKANQSNWHDAETDKFLLIYQRKLTFSFEVIEIDKVKDCFWAIK